MKLASGLFLSLNYNNYTIDDSSLISNSTITVPLGSLIRRLFAGVARQGVSVHCWRFAAIWSHILQFQQCAVCVHCMRVQHETMLKSFE